MQKKGINFIQLVSPTTSQIRLKKIIKDSHDMIYYISMLSTTGGKLKVSPRKILEKYNKIKKSFLKNKSRIGKKPFMYELSKIESLDINDIYEFKIAEQFHKLDLKI